jgi:hypothetical protein
MARGTFGLARPDSGPAPPRLVSLELTRRSASPRRARRTAEDEGHTFDPLDEA